MSRSELVSLPALTPGAPTIGEASASTPQLGAPEARPEATATSVIPDPTHHEPIPDSLNTDDISSLHQWAMEGLQDTVTPTTGSQGSTTPVVWITPGLVTRSQRRGPDPSKPICLAEPRRTKRQGFAVG